jgi:hypothetical protein
MAKRCVWIVRLQGEGAPAAFGSGWRCIELSDRVADRTVKVLPGEVE